MHNITTSAERLRLSHRLAKDTMLKLSFIIHTSSVIRDGSQALQDEPDEVMSKAEVTLAMCQ